MQGKGPHLQVETLWHWENPLLFICLEWGIKQGTIQ